MEHVTEMRCKEAVFSAEPAAAPCPGTYDRVDEGDVYKREHEERTQLDTFCDSARDDRRSGSGEHRLEQPIGKECKVAVVFR